MFKSTEKQGVSCISHLHVRLGMALALMYSGGDNMLWYAWVFLVIAIIAAIFGFGGIAAASAGIAKICFVIFLVLFLVSLLAGRRSAL
jgi:uncharacterized membrane protein YtjA (UPF0391 family)